MKGPSSDMDAEMASIHLLLKVNDFMLVVVNYLRPDWILVSFLSP